MTRPVKNPQTISAETRRALRLAQTSENPGALQALAYSLRADGFGWYVEDMEDPGDVVMSFGKAVKLHHDFIQIHITPREHGLLVERVSERYNRESVAYPVKNPILTIPYAADDEPISTEVIHI